MNVINMNNLNVKNINNLNISNINHINIHNIHINTMNIVVCANHSVARQGRGVKISLPRTLRIAAW